MKIVHTADWHIGKTVNDFSMLADQEYFLGKLKQKLIEEEVDVLIVAGDLYDRTVPSAQAVDLVNSFFCDIILNSNIKIICVAGNHDSGERLSFASDIIKASGLYMRGKLGKDCFEKITFTDEFGSVNFYAVPYVEPAQARFVFDEKDIHTFDDANRFITEKITEQMDKTQRNILIMHGNYSYISENKSDSSALSESEVSVGGADLVNASSYNAFDYAALGHIHESKAVGIDTIRYSGSLLKYSIDESAQNKDIPLIELGEKGETHISYLKIPPMRDLRIISGSFDDIISNDFDDTLPSEDYVFVNLTNTEPVADAIFRLRAKYPNIMGLKYNRRVSESNTMLTMETVEQKNPEQLFCEFYKAMTSDEITEEQRDIVKAVCKGVTDEAVYS